MTRTGRSSALYDDLTNVSMEKEMSCCILISESCSRACILTSVCRTSRGCPHMFTEKTELMQSFQNQMAILVFVVVDKFSCT